LLEFDANSNAEDILSDRRILKISPQRVACVERSFVSQTKIHRRLQLANGTIPHKSLVLNAGTHKPPSGSGRDEKICCVSKRHRKNGVSQHGDCGNVSKTENNIVSRNSELTFEPKERVDLVTSRP